MSREKFMFARQDSEGEAVRIVRKSRKTQTVPVKLETRRSEITLPQDVLNKLLRQQAQISKERRFDAFSLASAKTEVVAEEDLQKTLEANTHCHVHGIMKGVRTPGAEREWKFAVGTELPPQQPILISCQKGDKGGDKSPNQDNFSLTFFSNGYTLACVFDGHGQWGHLVSTRTVQTVPYFLIKSSSFPEDMERALVEAFERAHEDVVALALSQNWNVMASGTTAVAALWKGNRIWFANCGDSRCVVSSVSDGEVFYETADHKLEDEKESARISAAGGKIKTQTYEDGYTMHRLYIGQENYPGLAMSRSLGDVCVKDYGVIPTPEVTCREVDLSKRPFLILSSDGIWEFMSSDDVVKELVDIIENEGVKEALPGLHEKSMELWALEEGNYCDDITSVLVQLQP